MSRRDSVPNAFFGLEEGWASGIPDRTRFSAFPGCPTNAGKGLETVWRRTARSHLKLADYALSFIQNSLAQISDDVVACSSLDEIVILHQVVNCGSDCNPDRGALKFLVWMCHSVYGLTLFLLEAGDEKVTDGLLTDGLPTIPRELFAVTFLRRPRLHFSSL
jgi:hypothetical protein